MAIEIREVKNKRDLKTFIYLPEKIQAGRPNWVHPVYMDEEIFQPQKEQGLHVLRRDHAPGLP